MTNTIRRYRQRERARRAIVRLLEVLDEVYRENEVPLDQPTAELGWTLVGKLAPLLMKAEGKADILAVKAVRTRRQKQTHWSKVSRKRTAGRGDRASPEPS